MKNRINGRFICVELDIECKTERWIFPEDVARIYCSQGDTKITTHKGEEIY